MAWDHLLRESVAFPVAAVVMTILVHSFRYFFEKGLLRCCSFTWYGSLTPSSQHKVAGRLCCTLHHLGSAIFGAVALISNNPDICRFGLLWESGFELGDTVLVHLGYDGLTSIFGLPIFLHHYIAIIVQFVSLANGLPWELLAQLLFVLLLTGAYDMFHNKVLKETPLYHSKWMWWLSLFQLLMLLSLRFIWFSYVGYHLSLAAYRVAPHVGLIGVLTFTSFLGFHVVMLAAVLGALMNGGRMPEPFRSKRKKAKAQHPNDDAEMSSNVSTTV